jgi:hypothetical protein
VAKTINPKILGFNVVAGVIIVAAVATSVRNKLFPADPAPCAERMAQSVTLGLAHNGRILQAADFQAIANNMDAGVIDNLSIVPIRDAPAPIVMDIEIKAGTAQQNMPGVTGGGMSLPWSPRSLQPNLTHACLVYSVYLPSTFLFGESGTLPGLRGASRSLNSVNDEKFMTAVVWGEKGVARQFTYGGDNEAAHHDLTGAVKPVSLPKGRWVRIEQEVKLNDIGDRNGLSRLWVDGRFVVTRKDTVFRFARDSFITGVNIDVFFGGQGDEKNRGKALQNERIMLSPVEIRWN